MLNGLILVLILIIERSSLCQYLKEMPGRELKVEHIKLSQCAKTGRLNNDDTKDATPSLKSESLSGAESICHNRA